MDLMAVTVRTVSCVVTFAGATLTDVLEARGEVVVDTGWPTCSVFVTAKPVTGNEEDNLVVVAGAGNNVTRFTGKCRKFRSSVFPKGMEIIGMGSLSYAADWAPGGLPGFDDLFFEAVWGKGNGATDQQLVMDALNRVPQLGSGSYSSANIDGTGIVLGLSAPEAFDWPVGTKAWERIQAIDKATLYRTFQTRDGTIYRKQMIGHPNDPYSFTLGTADVLDGSTGQRDTLRTRNCVIIHGFDYGGEAGPAQNGQGTFQSNSFQGDGSNPNTRYTEEFSSNMIESGTDYDTGLWDGASGLRADDIAAQVINDVNKEFVEADIQSWRDDTHGPGLTCLLDMLARMAIGENMFVQRYNWRVTDGWYSQYGLSGGGLTAGYTAPPV